MNTARSTLSLFLPSIDNYPIGQHLLVARMLKGIWRNRLPGPKYESIWDVSKVFLYLSTISNENISLKQCTLKLISLLALVFLSGSKL